MYIIKLEDFELSKYIYSLICGSCTVHSSLHVSVLKPQEIYDL